MVLYLFISLNRLILKKEMHSLKNNALQHVIEKIATLVKLIVQIRVLIGNLDMTKKFFLLFGNLRYLKPVQFNRRIFLKLTRPVLFSLAIYPVVKIGRLNLLTSVVSYTALYSAIQTKFFLHEICAL